LSSPLLFSSLSPLNLVFFYETEALIASLALPVASFQSWLDSHLNPAHPLYILASLIDWNRFDEAYAPFYSEDKGAHGLPTRLLVACPIESVTDRFFVKASKIRTIQTQENFMMRPFSKDALSTISRRRFLTAGAAGIALAGIPMLPACTCRADEKKQKPKIAVQLYSVLNLARADLIGTLNELRKIGYTGVELADSLFNKSAGELRKIGSNAGLAFAGAHVGINEIKPDKLNAALDFYGELGTHYLTIPNGYGKTEKDWLDFAEIFNNAVTAAKTAGIRLGYHNHQHEFTDRVNGKTKFQIFFDAVSPEVNMQLEIGQIVSAGEDPIAWLKKYPGRAYTVHLTEVFDKAGSSRGILGQPGEGKTGVNWDAVLLALETDVTEWYVIEPIPDPKSLDNVRRCYEYLQTKGCV
jgi:sugar phosphate isomerase/epimerase